MPESRPAAVERMITDVLDKIPDFRFKNLSYVVQTPDTTAEYQAKTLLESKNDGISKMRGPIALSRGLNLDEWVRRFGLGIAHQVQFLHSLQVVVI